MNESSKIRDFLNELIAAQPEIVSLFNGCVLANQAIQDRDDIFVRRNVDGQDIVTVTGIITAISRKYGEAIASNYDEDWNVSSFSLYSECSTPPFPPLPEVASEDEPVL